ncbi:TetR/AcrR family transcriptional regulator [Actinomadura decatromicini]|uniref:TetR/AcrR family transcriptional regulator n=1 Tax=Actinomadura decatromicini TaxID=2604572 RepID=A0A5D3FMN2_9ACTN|nr:TetR/AcrR family transcriptional regulator [Actinomadura decatromicini]TYK49176.1 TetR/AcrR family transcriptional regulator [Actinomadura decatromicini]
MPGSDRAEDLTGRARIRDAALAQFAELGEKGATIRGIAKAAGVSPALVQHHYGTKEALRHACDEYVIQVIRETKEEALAGGMGDSGFLAIAMRTALPVQRYLARVLADDSPAARTLFDDAVAYSEDILARGAPGIAAPDTDDPHAYASVMTAMSFGLIVLHEHLSRALGGDVLMGDGYPRMALAMLDVLDDRLLSPELSAQARDALKALRAAGGRPPAEE